MQKNQIKILDTTLRDGQQCPGAGMALENNLAYAQLAKKVAVDILEAGFPAASQIDFKIVNTIAREFANDVAAPIVAAMCQAREPQVDITIEALQPSITAQKGRLHLYLPVDPILMNASLGAYANDKAKIIKDIYSLVEKAAKEGLEVQFSAEGYSRLADNFDFVTDLFRAALSAGATILNCADTIGGACYLQGDDYFVNYMNKHAAIINKEFPDKKITWSIHCHNDFGLALENTMNAVFGGPARQIEGCFNGIGERAGNVALEQCIMYLKHFGQNNVTKQVFESQAKSIYIQEISDFVAANMLPRQPNWPVSGSNSAKHSAGGHTNAIIRFPLAYNAFDPKEVGKDIELIFGPLSGSNHAKAVIERYGYRCDNNEKERITVFIKNYFEARKGITDEELMKAYFQYRSPIKARDFHYYRKNNVIWLRLDGQFFDHDSAFETHYEGDDSALAALSDAINVYMKDLKVESYFSQSTAEGITAKTKTTVIIQYQQHNYTGAAEESDMKISALKALVAAVNKAYVEDNYRIKH